MCSTHMPPCSLIVRVCGPKPGRAAAEFTVPVCRRSCAHDCCTHWRHVAAFMLTLAQAIPYLRASVYAFSLGDDLAPRVAEALL